MARRSQSVQIRWRRQTPAFFKESAMSHTQSQSTVDRSFQVRYVSLFERGPALAFPCDGKGRVDLDSLTDRVRSNYLFARAMVGRDFALPRVCPPADESAARLFM
jgi:hypothetical protein